MSEVAAPIPGTPAAPAPGAAPAAPAPGAAPAAFTTPWSNAQGVYMIGEGENAKPWYEGIQEEPVKEYMKTKNYANPYEAAMAAYNANKLNKLTPDIEAFVSGKATPEQEAGIFKMLGRPETPDAYELKPGEGVQTEAELDKLAKEVFFELGVPPARAQKAYDKYNAGVTAFNAAQAEAVRVQNETALAELGKRWGADLEVNRVAGNKAVHALGIPNTLVEKLEANMGSDSVVELLAIIGKKMGEGSFQGGGNTTDPNDPNTMTPQAAQARITQLQGDTEFQKKYTDATHPEHKQAVETMVKLFAKVG